MNPRGALLILVACSGDPPKTMTPPASPPTSAMSAEMLVSADGAATTAEAVLTTDKPVILQSDAKLTANGQAMAGGAGARYSASFAVAGAEGAAYTIALERATGAAPKSTCTLPAASMITTPSGGTLSRGNDDIAVAYAPSGTQDRVAWSVTGDCLEPTGLQDVTGDPGSFTIGRGGIKAKTSGTCSATLTIYRSRAGALDPAYGKGGTITCRQERGIGFTSAP